MDSLPATVTKINGYQAVAGAVQVQALARKARQSLISEQPVHSNASTKPSARQSNHLGAHFECLDPLARNKLRIQF